MSLNEQLIEACQLNQMTKVLELIRAGADVNAQNEIGLTPLHMATVGKFRHNVNYLLQKGANPNIKDNQGKTPLFLAETSVRDDNDNKGKIITALKNAGGVKGGRKRNKKSKKNKRKTIRKKRKTFKRK